MGWGLASGQGVSGLTAPETTLPERAGSGLRVLLMAPSFGLPMEGLAMLCEERRGCGSGSVVLAFLPWGGTSFSPKGRVLRW